MDAEIKPQIETNPDVPNIAERYKLLIDAKQFHFDNFSKWASYFYVAIGALFVAYYSIATSNKIVEQSEKSSLTLVLLMLGYICSMFWYWSAKGYYYWNINFISLVNYYEIEIFKWSKESSVYSVFANKKDQNKYFSPIHGANISTSKLAILFAYVITVTWGFLLFNKLFANLCWSPCSVTIFSLLISISIIFILSVTIVKWCLLSKTDILFDLKYTPQKRDK